MEKYEKYLKARKRFYALDGKFKELLSKLDHKPGEGVYIWTKEDSDLVGEHHEAEQELHEALIEYGDEIRGKRS